MSSIIYKKQNIKLTGNQLQIGDNAPKVTLKTKNLASVEIAPPGKTQILLTFPSLDTQVCSKQAKETNKRLASIKNIEVIVISMDLPFAMDRFCATEGIDNIIVASDFAFKDFGTNYGVLIHDSIFAGLLARSAFVVKDEKIIYKQLVKELMGKIDFKDLELFIQNDYRYSLN
ncbi:thiol peroxidase [Campylobacter sp. IFREMER_LSEM_CL1846]|uniref:thiol peroxidase n=1 Tax=Campylobacter TaxID=194 RepID=UPI001059FE0C|nr:MULTISPECIES: thiol peroxidase [Campylobacter]MCR8708731.1 thiol peroxidase [Campylobacter sp. RM5063]EAI4440797.1 thiol peroxidase [Campylobacter lari]EAK0952133.1 thiol peroxidase [Campylobacter lari]MCV3409654.1 thiol peroxidase [Campylobacter sp. IFREMER_LSEM_CL1890]MCV3434394.1 thiol peroxidase [Campylobacter sp. IFREMER_LSEM_CL1846]